MRRWETTLRPRPRLFSTTENSTRPESCEKGITSRLLVIRDEFVVTRVPCCTRRAHASGKLAGIELMVTGQPSRLPFCRECLPADCGTYFFKIVRQFSTTVKGTEALCVIA